VLGYTALQRRVLNRAVWSSLEASRILLMILVAMFIPDGTIIMSIDDTSVGSGIFRVSVRVECVYQRKKQLLSTAPHWECKILCPL
jgi:hypothetical protein